MGSWISLVAALKDCKCFIAVAACHGCSRRVSDPVKFAAMQTYQLSAFLFYYNNTFFLITLKFSFVLDVQTCACKASILPLHVPLVSN